MNIKLDNNDVIAAGSCVVLVNQTLKFEFNANFIVEIGFVDDDTKQQRIESKVDNGVLIIQFCNCNNSLGTTNRKSLDLGIMQGHTLKLNCAVYYIGDDNSHSRIFTYTFFSVNEEQKNG